MIHAESRWVLFFQQLVNLRHNFVGLILTKRIGSNSIARSEHMYIRYCSIYRNVRYDSLPKPANPVFSGKLALVIVAEGLSEVHAIFNGLVDQA